MSQSLIIGALLGCVILALAFLRAAIGTLSRNRGDRAGEGGQSTQGARGLRAMGALLRPRSDEELGQLKSRTVQAGLYGRDALDLFLSARLIVLVVGTGLAVLALSAFGDDPLMALVSTGAIGFAALVGPRVWLEARIRERQAAIAAALPATLDLWVVCLEAGLGLKQALDRLVQSAARSGKQQSLLAAELEMVASDMNVGMPVERAFRRFAERVGSEEVNAVAAVVARGASLGAKVADVLRNHADAVRKKQLLALEESTGKANAKMALPLAIFLMPAALLMMVGPAFLRLFQVL